jgi:probable HAF family extracellular repeat protein
MNRFREVVPIVVASLLAFAPFALAQGTYTQIDYPGATFTLVYGIDTAGDIVGSYTATTTHGFLLSGGVYSSIDHPGSRDTDIYGLNDVGQMVGMATDKDYQSHAFVYDLSDQSFTQIRYPGAQHTGAVAINNAGMIAGDFSNLGGPDTGFESDGHKYRPITMPNWSNSFVYAVSTSGKLLGFGSGSGGGGVFLFAGGTYKKINVPGNPLGMNPAGDAIVGTEQLSSGSIVGFLFQSGTSTTLQFPGSVATFATGINDAGEVVGYFLDTSSTYHGFTWVPPSAAERK